MLRYNGQPSIKGAYVHHSVEESRTCSSFGLPQGRLGIVRKLQATTDAVSAVCAHTSTHHSVLL